MLPIPSAWSPAPLSALNKYEMKAERSQSTQSIVRRVCTSVLQQQCAQIKLSDTGTTCHIPHAMHMHGHMHTINAETVLHTSANTHTHTLSPTHTQFYLHTHTAPTKFMKATRHVGIDSLFGQTNTLTKHCVLQCNICSVTGYVRHTKGFHCDHLSRNATALHKLYA